MAPPGNCQLPSSWTRKTSPLHSRSSRARFTRPFPSWGNSCCPFFENTFRASSLNKVGPQAGGAWQARYLLKIPYRSWSDWLGNPSCQVNIFMNNRSPLRNSGLTTFNFNFYVFKLTTCCDGRQHGESVSLKLLYHGSFSRLLHCLRGRNE